jgi:two-component system heavy metal sensor histidine kinase CusS
MIQTEENNTVYRSISRRVAVTPEQGKSKHVIITVAGYWVSHPVYG